MATLAAHAAFIVARLVRAPVGGLGLALSLFPMIVWGLGMFRRSPGVLLVLVPLAWAMPAYIEDPRAFAAGPGLTCAITLLAYAIAVLSWLRGSHVDAVPPDWESLPPDKETAADVPFAASPGVPWVAAALIVGPGAAFLTFGAPESTLRQGFGGLAGLVGAGLCVLGTLLGAAMATDLHRPRFARLGRRRRVASAAVVLVALLVAWAGLGLR